MEIEMGDGGWRMRRQDGEMMRAKLWRQRQIRWPPLRVIRVMVRSMYSRRRKHVETKWTGCFGARGVDAKW
jgi:hypothetical protein